MIRKVKKMVPVWSIPGAVSFNDALAAGRSLKLAKPKAAAKPKPDTKPAG